MAYLEIHICALSDTSEEAGLFQVNYWVSKFFFNFSNFILFLNFT